MKEITILDVDPRIGSLRCGCEKAGLMNRSVYLASRGRNPDFILVTLILRGLGCFGDASTDLTWIVIRE